MAFKSEKIRNLLKSAKEKTVEILCRPVTQDLPFLILMFCIVTCVPVYHHYVAVGDSMVQFTILTLLQFYVIVYAAVCILNINRHLCRVLKPVLYVLTFIYMTLNIFCINACSCLLNYNIIEIVKETTTGETKDFIETYCSWKDAVLFAVLVVIGTAAYIAAAKIKLKPSRGVTRGFVAGAFVSLTVLCICPINMGRWLLYDLDSIVDLSNYRQYPSVVEDEDTPLPQNIVVIVGESFASSHSSLYGYEKETNPRLAEKRDEGSLVVFGGGVTSPQTHTSACFKYILNTFRLGMEEESQWYKSTTLLEVLSTAGYHTAWVSNQVKHGVFDNIASGHHTICDEAVFVNDDRGDHYDGELLSYAAGDTTVRNAVFYHLMGQHNAFKNRYPHDQGFDIFKPSDYKFNNDKKRSLLAYYDNATFYNDYVVSSIIDKYKDTDAVIFYFPDHGLDMYDTDPDYCGHAKFTEKSEAFGKKIPFMVYLTPRYQQLRPELTERIRGAVNNTFCTDKFIYAAMDAAGLRFADNDDVAVYSPFSTAK